MRFPTLLLSTVTACALPLSCAAYSFPSSAAATGTSSSRPLSHRALEVQLRQQWQQNASSTRSSSSSSTQQTQGTFHYVPYPGNAIGKGQSALLFFCADWSHQCQFTDKLLRSWSNEKPFLVPLYKMDYDHETTLRSTYKVTHVSTFVYVDGKGTLVKLMESAPESWIKMVLYGR